MAIVKMIFRQNFRFYSMIVRRSYEYLDYDIFSLIIYIYNKAKIYKYKSCVMLGGTSFLL